MLRARCIRAKHVQKWHKLMVGIIDRLAEIAAAERAAGDLRAQHGDLAETFCMRELSISQTPVWRRAQITDVMKALRWVGRA